MFTSIVTIIYRHLHNHRNLRYHPLHHLHIREFLNHMDHYHRSGNTKPKIYLDIIFYLINRLINPNYKQQKFGLNY